MAVVIDTNTRYQSIDGWGGSEGYCGTLGEADYVPLFDTCRLNIVRAFIRSDGTPWNGWTQLAAMSARGASVFGVPLSPPAAWKTNGSETNGGYLLPAYYDAWAQRLADWATAATAAGVSVCGISLQNEPDYAAEYWSCLYSDSDLATLAASLRTRIPAGIQLIAPERTGPQAGEPDGNLRPAIDVAGFHQYTPFDPMPFWAATGKPVWETEVADGGAEDRGITSALAYAYKLWDAVVRGQANAWMYWQLVGNDNTGWPLAPGEGWANEGLIDTNPDGTRAITKRLWMLGHWSRFVRPGYARVACSGAPSGVYASAFAPDAGSRRVVVLINSGGAQTVTVSGLGDIASVTPWITDATRDLAAQTPAAVTAGSVDYAVPASSVVTLTGGYSVTAGSVSGTTVTLSGECETGATISVT